MGHIHAEIEMVNGSGFACGMPVKIKMIINSGSTQTFINKNIQQLLQLSDLGTREIRMADGKIIECPYVGPLTVKFENKQYLGGAIVLPDDSAPVLGKTAMLGMGVKFDSMRDELVVDPKARDFAMHQFTRLRFVETTKPKAN